MEERPEDHAQELSPRVSEDSLAAMALGMRKLGAEPPTAANLAPLPEDLALQIQGYEIQSLIGQGGMGMVYRVVQADLGRTVALKLLSAALLEKDDGEDYLGRFLREGQVLAALNHPGIVQVYESGTLEDGTPFLIMECLEGGDLAARLKTAGRLPTADLLPLALQITEALHAAHQAGVIHRDIKPANLLLSTDGRVKIADFGLARRTNLEASALTQKSTAPGTPIFTAPELQRGATPSAQSDLYALGVTFYQLLTGHLPQLDFQPPSAAVPGIDLRWDGLIQQMLKTEPQQRPRDALEVKARLLQLAQAPTRQRSGHWKRLFIPVGAVAALSTAFFVWQNLPPRVDEPIDLLPRFDMISGVISGHWEKTPQGLSVKAADGGPFIISAPLDAGTDFDFEVEFSSANPDISTFNQFFHVGDTLVEWTLNAHPSWERPYHGFPRLDGKNITSTPETHSREAVHLVSGRRYRSRVEVRQGQLSGWLDDRQLVLWKGDLTRFTRAAHFPIPRGHFAILSWTGGATFHQVTVTHRRPGELTPADQEKRPFIPAPPALVANAARPHENSLGMKFVCLPGTQTLIAIHETRRQDYAEYAAAVPGVDTDWQHAFREGQPVGHDPDHPVVNVCWQDAKAFCEWLSQKEGLHYRLPTDREWSIAVGIADLEPPALLTPEELGQMNPGIYSWGSQWPPPPRAGNLNDTVHYEAFHIDPKPDYTDGYATTSPVMSFKPNTLGIYDLSGNVWEWCEDWINERQEQRVLRGCHFGDIKLKYYPASCRTSRRPTTRMLCDGFRCVIDLSATASAPPPTPVTKAESPLPAHLTAPHENSLGMKFVHLPGTRVQIGIHEVRRQDYAAYAETSRTIDSKWHQAIGHGLPAGHLPDHPVVCVSWHDATAFCDWLSQKENRRYRLPTDREWSLAVGLGPQETTTEPPAKLSGRWLRLFPWGESWPPSPKAGNYSNLAFSPPDFNVSQISTEPLDGFISTAPVMSFPPNALGIYDLGGNVWEWLQEPLHPTLPDRILRGAGWDNHTQTDLRSSYRHRDPPHYRLPTNGFRCVLELEEPPEKK